MVGGSQIETQGIIRIVISHTTYRSQPLLSIEQVAVERFDLRGILWCLSGSESLRVDCTFCFPDEKVTYRHAAVQRIEKLENAPFGPNEIPLDFGKDEFFRINMFQKVSNRLGHVIYPIG